MSSTLDVVAIENGELSHDELVEQFQQAINSGLAWRLQGSYGRTAMQMIEEGYCILGEERHTDYYGNVVPSRYDVKPGTKGSAEYAALKQAERG